MQDFIGSYALVFCFAAIVIGPFLLPKLTDEDGQRPVDDRAVDVPDAEVRAARRRRVKA